MEGKFFIIFSLISLILITSVSAITWSGGSVQTVNDTEIWITNIGNLDDVNSTQFENVGGVLSIIKGWLDDLYVNVDGDTMTGDLDMGENNISRIAFLLDSLSSPSIDVDNRILYAEDGIDSILDYFIVGVADFGDSVIRTINDIEARNITVSDWFNGKFNWTSGDNWNIFDGSTLTFNSSKLSTQFFNASTIEVITGTPQGAIGDLRSYNNIPFNISEDASDVELRVNFSIGVDGDFNELIVRYKSAEEDEPHTLIVQIRECDNTWEEYGTLPGTSHYHIVEFGVFDSDDHICNGVVQVRFYQLESPPNRQHLHNFDWVTISKGFGTPSGEEVDPDSIHKDGDVPWIGNEQGNGFNTTGWFQGLFDYLGSSLKRVKKLWVQDIDSNGTIQANMINASIINTTNILVDHIAEKETGHGVVVDNNINMQTEGNKILFPDTSIGSSIGKIYQGDAGGADGLYLYIENDELGSVERIILKTSFVEIPKTLLVGGDLTTTGNISADYCNANVGNFTNLNSQRGEFENVSSNIFQINPIGAVAITNCPCGSWCGNSTNFFFNASICV